MADIFLSYARTDAARAGQLSEELEGRGFSVFWDIEILPGQRWRDVIHSELVEADCVIVMWSAGSASSRWVVEEASEALEAGKLVPVLVDGAPPPFGFRGVEAANLADWVPGVPSPEVENLVSAVRSIVAPAATAHSAPAAGEAVRGPAETEAMPRDEGVPGDSVIAEDVDEEQQGTPIRAAAARPSPPEDEAEQRSRQPVGPEADREDSEAPVWSGAETPSARGERGPAGATFRGIRGLVGRMGRGGIAAIAAALLLVPVFFMATGGGDGGGGGSTTTVTETTAITIAPQESDVVTVFLAGETPVIDGDLGEWETIAEQYHLRREVFRDAGVTERLGEDSPGVVAAQYDRGALYLAVVSDDDIYSQLNTGNQIWRGDALDINLTTASADAVSGRPDGDDFQVTMTPRDADGNPAHVWFTGNGTAFFDNSTSRPVELAGTVSASGAWQLEAAIPWSVFGLDAPPPSDLVALVAVFDNDGETVDGVPRQTVILGHTEAEFQRPPT